MKLKRCIAWVLCALYIAATATTALASLTCGCRGMMRAESVHRCTACCYDGHLAAERAAESCSLGSGCDCDRHSTEIELYTSTHSDDSEKYIRCIVSELPPALTAEAPSADAALPLTGDLRLRPTPLDETMLLRSVGLRAPPCRG